MLSLHEQERNIQCADFSFEPVAIQYMDAVGYLSTFVRISRTGPEEHGEADEKKQKTLTQDTKLESRRFEVELSVRVTPRASVTDGSVYVLGLHQKPLPLYLVGLAIDKYSSS